MTSRSDRVRSLQRWIALAEIRPAARGIALFKGGAGFFANVVGLAESRGAFINAVELKSKSLGGVLVEIEEVETLAARLKGSTVSSEVMDAAETLTTDGDVEFATLDIYERDDA